MWTNSNQSRAGIWLISASFSLLKVMAGFCDFQDSSLVKAISLDVRCGCMQEGNANNHTWFSLSRSSDMDNLANYGNPTQYVWLVKGHKIRYGRTEVMLARLSRNVCRLLSQCGMIFNSSLQRWKSLKIHHPSVPFIAWRQRETILQSEMHLQKKKTLTKKNVFLNFAAWNSTLQANAKTVTFLPRRHKFWPKFVYCFI